MKNELLLSRLRGQLRSVTVSILTLESRSGDGSLFDRGLVAGQLIELHVQRNWLADLIEEIERGAGHDAVG